MSHQGRSTVQDLVIIHVDHRTDSRIRLRREGHVEQQTTILGETAVTQNLLMRNTQTILRSTSEIPRITQCDTRTSIDTVNILERRGEDDTGSTDTRRPNFRRLDLYENVERGEQRHVGNVDTIVGNRAIGSPGADERATKQ